MTTSTESHRAHPDAVLLSCDTLHVIYPAPDQLSSAERAFMINATEIDILPGVWGDLDEPLVSGSASALVPILLALVDRGWIEVCRVVPWTAPDGTPGEQPGLPIAKQDLPLSWRTSRTGSTRNPARGWGASR